MGVGGNKVGIIARESDAPVDATVAIGASLREGPRRGNAARPGRTPYKLVTSGHTTALTPEGMNERILVISGWLRLPPHGQQSVAGSRPRSACTRRAAIMFRASSRESLFHARLDIAFRLAANGSQLRNNEISRTFEHPLFTK